MSHQIPVIGMGTMYVMMGLRSDRLPFGTAVKMSGRWRYHISRKLLLEYIGEKAEKEATS